MPKRLAVLASGAGTLQRAIIAQKIPIKLMVADRKCLALEMAASMGVPCTLLSRTFDASFDRVAYTETMVALLRQHGIEFVAMAGFMTVFSPEMFAPDAYRGKVLNTHPSLLPAFPGPTAVKDALFYGVKYTGCTV